MTYVDGFVIAIPKNRINMYKKMALEGKRMWKKYGALDYYECIGDDLNPNMGGMKMLGFPKMIKLKKNESLWYSFIIYKSKKQRDEINKKVMKEMEKKMEKDKNVSMPFEFNRFAFGGFKAIVE